MLENEGNLAKIYNHFGEETQLEKLKEEVLELIEAILEKDLEHIHEEFTDVKVMMKQIHKAYNLRNWKIAEIEKEKIERTLERIDTGYYEKIPFTE